MITTVNTFRDWLDRELQTRGVSQRKFALSAGVSPSMVSEVINGNRNPGWDFCAAIAKPLGKTPLEMFQRAGLLPGGSPRRLNDSRAEYYASSLSDQEAEVLDTFRELSEINRMNIARMMQTLLDLQKGR